jgi:hypothetical protein
MPSRRTRRHDDNSPEVGFRLPILGSLGDNRATRSLTEFWARCRQPGSRACNILDEWEIADALIDRPE